MKENGISYDIRGHHLGLLRYVDSVHLELERAGCKTLPFAAEESLLESFFSEMWNLSDAIYDDSELGEYARDILGGDRGKVEFIAATFARGLLGIYRAGEETPKTTVKVHTGIDPLCKACVRGEHCKSPGIADEDTQFIKELERESTTLKLPTERDSDSIRIPAGALRKVLREMNINDRTFSREDTNETSVF